MDLEKYRTLFLEEATEHLAEISRALIELEKDASRGEALELVFRMAHSIKSMAASLGYDAIRDLAHRLEDRMEASRAAGRVDPGQDLPLLFRGLESLESMVEVVRERGEPPPADPSLLDELLAAGEEPGGAAGEPGRTLETAPKKAPAGP